MQVKGNTLDNSHIRVAENILNKVFYMFDPFPTKEYTVSKDGTVFHRDTPLLPPSNLGRTLFIYRSGEMIIEHQMIYSITTGYEVWFETRYTQRTCQYTVAVHDTDSGLLSVGGPFKTPEICEKMACSYLINNVLYS